MDTPKGRRFSLNYIVREEPTQDSPRFRVRLARALDDALGYNIDFLTAVESEIGVTVPRLGYSAAHWDKFFAQAAVRDVLDAITVVATALRNGGYPSLAEQFRDRVRRIIAEENLGYRLDDLAGVHLGVDDEFEHNRTSIIRDMGLPRYASARQSFEAAYTALDRSPPDGRGAVRLTFDALETVFKLILGTKVSRLGAAEIEKQLKPAVNELYQGQARDAVNLMLNSFADWVNAMHNYRHAAGAEVHEEVPLDVAILVMSSGAGFLRWLVGLDQQLAAK